MLIDLICFKFQVIRCRDSDFRDLAAVPILLQTYALVNAVPQSSLMYHKASDCCCDIIATLLAYTQPLLQASSNVGGVGSVATKNSSAEEALSRSLWTQMVQEILKYILTCSGPAAFITGLQILNEILPLPLPLGIYLFRYLPRLHLLSLFIAIGFRIKGSIFKFVVFHQDIHFSSLSSAEKRQTRRWRCPRNTQRAQVMERSSTHSQSPTAPSRHDAVLCGIAATSNPTKSVYPDRWFVRVNGPCNRPRRRRRYHHQLPTWTLERSRW